MAHQGKERRYVQALTQAGYASTNRMAGRLDFALVDHDVRLDVPGFRPKLIRLHEMGVPIFMYPHAARPMILWDGMYKAFPHTRCSFIIGEGHAEVMRRYGYQLPTEITGWALCEQKEFQPVKELRTILFAPIHPYPTGYLPKVDKETNRDAFKRLVEYCKTTGVRLIVRFIHDLENNGIWREKGVQYIRALPDGSTKDMDEADLIVSHQTFAYMSISRGKPTIMMGEFKPPSSGHTDETFITVKSWDKYKELMMYPIDLLVGKTSEIIERAIRSDDEIQVWKRLFIGKPFDPTYFVERLETYL